MRTLLILAAMLSMLPFAAAQRPAFTVAAIHECAAGDQSADSWSPGRITVGCWPLWRLIAEAYMTYPNGRVDLTNLFVPSQPDGGPEWVRSTRYAINAESEGPASAAMMRGPMMQTLLEERFHLRVHRETREVSGWLMTVAKGGPKLKAAEEGSCAYLDPEHADKTGKALGGKPPCLTPMMRRNGQLMVMDIYGIKLDGFARFLHPNGLPVFDRTGLTGKFDIHLEWEADAENGGADEVIRALREQLGLRLDTGKGTRGSLVIDHVERPSGN